MSNVIVSLVPAMLGSRVAQRFPSLAFQPVPPLAMNVHRPRFPFSFALAFACVLMIAAPGLAPRACAEVLLDSFGERWLEDWRVEGGGRVKIEDRTLIVSAGDLDANPVLTTRAEFALGARKQFVLVLHDIAHATRSNHATAGFDIGLGKALTLRITTWGDGGGIQFGGGGAFKLFQSRPVAAKGGVSLELEYNSATRRLVVRQFGGLVKVGPEWKPTTPKSPVFIFDEILDTPLDLASPTPLTVRIRSQHNGGTATEGTRLGGLLFEAR